MLFNVFPQLVIILALVGVFYIIIRKDIRVLEKEKRIIKKSKITLKKSLTFIKKVDYKKYLETIKKEINKIINKTKKKKKEKTIIKKEDDSAIRKMIAEQKYIKLISENPRNITAYLKLGQLYKEQKNYTDAKGCFVQILRIDSDNKSAKRELKNMPS